MLTPTHGVKRVRDYSIIQDVSAEYCTDLHACTIWYSKRFLSSQPQHTDNYENKHHRQGFVLTKRLIN